MADKDETQSIEDMTADADVRHYTAERQEFTKQARQWRKDAKHYTERYRNDDVDTRRNRRYNIFWANTQILLAATFSQSPQPDVSRRWSNQDDALQKIARQAAIVLEKALRYGADQRSEFQRPLRKANLDALVVGLGQVRVRVDQEMQDFDDGSTVSVDQSAPLEYVYWDAFRWSPARTWEDVWWIEYDHLMTLDDLRNHYATRSKSSEIPRNVTVSARSGHSRIDERDHWEPPSSLNRARVIERWDRRRGKRIWLAESFPNVLLEEDPPAQFEGFFDCPEPLVYNRTNDVYMPIADYSYYRDMATELDDLTNRLAGLVSQAKASYFYDKIMTEWPSLADASDGMGLPVDMGASAGATGGLSGRVWFWPVESVVIAIRELMLRQENLRQQIFEITGISDIVRGSTSPSETLGAQELKASFGNFRLSDKQEEMKRFIEESLILQGEVAAELYSPETLQRITGEQITPEVMQLLRNDQMRGYRVDVSLEELVRPDQERQKAMASEYLAAMTSFIETAVPAISAAPTIAPLIGEMGKFANRQFKAGREMEESFDQAMNQLVQQAQQPPEPPEPDPDTVLQEQGDTQRQAMGDQTKLKVAAINQLGTLQGKLIDQQERRASGE